MSRVDQKYSLGSQFVNKMIRLQDAPEAQGIKEKTRARIHALQEDSKSHEQRSAAANHWKQAVVKVLQGATGGRSKIHYQNHMKISATEHMSTVDAFDGSNARKGKDCDTGALDAISEDLLVVTPAIDGRLKNVAKDAS